jgi:hypothetical protein
VKYLIRYPDRTNNPTLAHCGLLGAPKASVPLTAEHYVPVHSGTIRLIKDGEPVEVVTFISEHSNVGTPDTLMSNFSNVLEWCRADNEKGKPRAHTAELSIRWWDGVTVTVSHNLVGDERWGIWPSFIFYYALKDKQNEHPEAWARLAKECHRWEGKNDE